MPFTIIEELRNASAEERADIITSLYEKNYLFFKKKYPEVQAYLDRCVCPYHINMTERFLEVVHTPSDNVAHPEAGLDLFAEMLGEWTHDAWIDFCNFTVSIPDDGLEHARLYMHFDEEMHRAFPEFRPRFASRCINLKKVGDNESERMFSTPVVFVGIFHGLHIAHYLSRTKLTDVLLVEPEPERFMVSCYFLDYELLDKQVKMHLVIDSSIPSEILNTFLSWTKVTPFIWLRVLPGYVSDRVDSVIASIRLWQVQFCDVVRPFDMDLEGMKSAVINIKERLPVLSVQPRLSENSVIAVVGAGPSLKNDIKWLKKNREKLIIFSSHSAVRVLRSHGIKPDLQFSLDTKFAPEELERLNMFREIPLVTLSRADSYLTEYFEHVFLVEEPFKAHAVRFYQYLFNLAPSTGNLALSMALFCQPGTVYMVGLDFGYRNRGQHHAEGSIYDNEVCETDLNERDLLKIISNLTGKNEIITEPFYNIARTSAEACIAANRGRTAVYNMSDGALVRGAAPKYSFKVKLDTYQDRESDLKAIRECFRPAEQNVNWEPFQTPGSEVLGRMESIILDSLKLEKFEWPDFSRAIDRVMPNLKLIGDGDDDPGRQEVFYRFVMDLLLGFYRFMIFCEGEEEAERIYRVGMDALKNTLTKLDWPAELDLYEPSRE